MIALALAGALLVSPGPPPNSYEALVARGLDLGREGRFDDASRAFDAAILENPSRPEAWGERGGLRFLEKRYPEAARDFAELLKKYPKAQRAPEGMLKLGLALFELGQMKEGCAALVALPAKYPDATPAVAARARSERTNNKCR